MTPGERQLAREAFRRVATGAAPEAGNAVASLRQRLRAGLFNKQLAFMEDEAKAKAALCTRRAGKTTETAVDLLDAPLETPGSEALYLTITRERAKDLLWGELKALNYRLQLGLRFNEVELTATLPEGLGKGRVKLAGADKAKEIEKRRGSKYRRVRIDEAQVFGDYLKPLVEDVLEPALVDYRGDLGLLGTPGVVCAGLFHDVTTGKLPGWSVHRWSILDNPHIPHAAAWLEEKKRERGWTEEEATYQREWLGRWVNDTGALFYRFEEGRNTFAALPDSEWQWVFGVDLGYDDAFAFHGWCFSRTSPILYGPRSFAQSGLTPSTWFDMLRALNAQYRPRCFVVDTGGLGKAIVEDGKKRYPELPLKAAEKHDKPGAVALLNSDLVAGLVKIDGNGPLAKEWRVLPKDADNPLTEDARFPNHVSDAALYAHREARHYLGAVPQARPAFGTPEYHREEEEKMRASVFAKLKRQQEGDESAPSFSDEGDFSGFDSF